MNTAEVTASGRRLCFVDDNTGDDNDNNNHSSDRAIKNGV